MGTGPDGTTTGNGGEHPTPGITWQHLVKGSYAINRPVVAGATVIFQSDTLVYSLHRDDGEVAWATDLQSDPNYYTPALASGTVFAAGRGSPNSSRRGTLTALDAESGEVDWRVDVDVSSSPAVSSAGVLFAADPPEAPGTVRAVDPADGSPRWTFEVPDGVHSNVDYPPAVADGRLFVAATIQNEAGPVTGAIYALDPDDGTELWRRHVDGRPDARPVVDDGAVYMAAASGGALHSFGVESGEHRWSNTERTAASNYWVRPVVADGLVYAGNVGGAKAFDAGTGRVEWEVTNNRLSGNGVVVHGDTVYSAGTSLFALSADDGAIEWSFERLNLPSTAFSPPAIVDGVAYVGSCLKEDPSDEYDHVIFALDADGDE